MTCLRRALRLSYDSGVTLGSAIISRITTTRADSISDLVGGWEGGVGSLMRAITPLRSLVVVAVEGVEPSEQVF